MPPPCGSDLGTMLVDLVRAGVSGDPGTVLLDVISGAGSPTVVLQVLQHVVVSLRAARGRGGGQPPGGTRRPRTPRGRAGWLRTRRSRRPAPPARRGRRSSSDALRPGPGVALECSSAGS